MLPSVAGMGAHEGSARTPRGPAGRHRRTGQALIERRDHTEQKRSRRFSLPSPHPSALIGIAVLVLIAVGVIHLSSTGSAVPVERQEIAATGSATGAVEAEADGADSLPDPGSSAPEDSSPEAAEAGPESGTAPDAPAAGKGAKTEPGSSAELIVHVSGAVASPGVVRLPAGSRVDDALLAAGGSAPEADLAAVNLARPVTDGEQIHVPVPGEDPPAAAADGAASEPEAGGGGGEGAGSSGGSPINLNTASAAQLEELPGVGPAIAQRILEHRERNGQFTAVDGLLEVSGIGPATLEKIREQATV